MPSGIYKKTKEHLLKISNSLKGRKVWNKGMKNVYKMPPASEDKKIKISNSLKGHIISESTKEKIRIGNIGKQCGNKNKAWKGGLSSKSKIIRNSYEYAYWRKLCFEKDNFTCQKCEQHGGNLIVHHINNFSEFPELRFVVNNGVVFCKECHYNFHNKFGFKNNTKEQLIEYLTKNI